MISNTRIFKVTEYLAATFALTTLELGALWLLILSCEQAQIRPSRIPDDDVRLARIARLTKTQWLRIRPHLECFWTKEVEGLLTLDDYFEDAD